MVAGAFDVVVVPDFAGPRAREFEARTLLFLGSWLENAGVARDYPLHVACIGEPPARVHAMVKRCQADITVHEPVRANRGRYANKLRGLEVAGHTPFVLLLDADIVTLADPSPLRGLGHVIALAASRSLKVPEGSWARMFTACDVEPPTHRILDAFGQLGPPYYNSGAIYLPWSCGLREIWEQDMRAVAELLPVADPFAAKVRRNDQFGLAVALERLRHRGIPVILLPRGFNVYWSHFWRGRMLPGDVTLLHAMHVFRRDLGRLALRHQLRYFRAASLGKVRRVRVGGRRPALRDLARALRHVYDIGLRMQRIWDRQVEPVLREGPDLEGWAR